MYFNSCSTGLWLQSGDSQTLAQKLQLRVPSVESLFRSPIKEFWSSKESLVRTSSRESLNQLDLDCPAAAFDPPSDMESEAEDAPGSSDSLSREQLLQRLRRMERSLSSYRGKYSEVGAGSGPHCSYIPLGLFSRSYYCIALSLRLADPGPGYWGRVVCGRTKLGLLWYRGLVAD